MTVDKKRGRIKEDNKTEDRKEEVEERRRKWHSRRKKILKNGVEEGGKTVMRWIRRCVRGYNVGMDRWKKLREMDELIK